MKSKLFMMLATIILSTSATAQKIAAEKVPAPVKTAFDAKFPKAEKVSWESENPNEYEADFKINGVEHSASFDQDGNWLETETEIKVADLPKAVTESIARQFSGYKIEEAEIVEKKDVGNCFEVEMEKGKEEIEVVILPNGEIVSKKIEKEDKDEGDEKE